MLIFNYLYSVPSAWWGMVWDSDWYSSLVVCFCFGKYWLARQVVPVLLYDVTKVNNKCMLKLPCQSATFHPAGYKQHTCQISGFSSPPAWRLVVLLLGKEEPEPEVKFEEECLMKVFIICWCQDLREWWLNDTGNLYELFFLAWKQMPTSFFKKKTLIRLICLCVSS